MSDFGLGLGKWKSATYDQTMNLYSIEGVNHAGITAMTTPYNNCSSISSLGGYNFGSYGYSNNSMAMDIYYNMQDNGVTFPSLIGTRSRLAGDMINETSMWSDMNLCDICCGIGNKFTAIGLENIFTKLSSGNF